EVPLPHIPKRVVVLFETVRDVATVSPVLPHLRQLSVLCERGIGAICGNVVDWDCNALAVVVVLISGVRLAVQDFSLTVLTVPSRFLGLIDRATGDEHCAEPARGSGGEIGRASCRERGKA